MAPNSNTAIFYAHGDKPWFAEYHWTGGQWLGGNSFVLGGLVLLGVLALLAFAPRPRLPARARQPAAAGDGRRPDGAVPREPIA